MIAFRAPALLGVGWLVAGCAGDADIRPTDVRQYRAPRESIATDSPTRSQAAAPAPRLRYEVPEGWSDRGASGMRLATLAIPEQNGTHEVTVIPASGTLESNVARWAGQLDNQADSEGRDRSAAEAIAGVETIDVDGTKAAVVMLVAPAANEPDGNGEAILGAMIPVDATSALFVKYKGTATVARRERDNFVRFVSSIRWK